MSLKMTIKNVVAGLLLALSVICGAAQAQIQVISFQDDDVDFLLREDANGDLQAVTGAFQVGDVLVAVFEMPTYTIDGVSQIPAGSELTGIGVIQIGTLTVLGGGFTLITFVPYEDGFNAVSPVDVVNGDADEGTMVAMWLNSTSGDGGDTNLRLDFADFPAVSCTSLDDCLTQASLGSLVQVDGFGGDADNFWTAFALPGGASTSIVLGIGGSTSVALFNAALTTFFNSTGDILFLNSTTGLYCPAGTTALDNCVQGPTLSGSIQGGGGTTPLNAGIVADGAFARSDLDATKLQAAPVPEPGTLALIGMALAGLAAARRRRQ